MFRTVSFRCPDPVEWEYSERGHLVAPGGKDLANEIVRSLVQSGARASEVERHEDYGWSFTSYVGAESFHQVVNAFDNEVHVTINMHGPRPACDRYCELVGVALHAIPWVSEVQWANYTT